MTCLAVRTLFPHVLLPEFSVPSLLPDEDPLRCFPQPPPAAGPAKRRRPARNAVTEQGVHRHVTTLPSQRGERSVSNSIDLSTFISNRNTRKGCGNRAWSTSTVFNRNLRGVECPTHPPNMSLFAPLLKEMYVTKITVVKS